MPGYIAAQLLGAFLGAVLVHVVYKGAIDSREHANHITRGAANSVPTYSIFAPFPAKYLGNWVDRSSIRWSAPRSWSPSCSRSSTTSTSPCGPTSRRS